MVDINYSGVSAQQVEQQVQDAIDTLNAQIASQLIWELHDSEIITTGTSSVSFTSLPSKKIWLVIFRLLPDFTSDQNDVLGLRINNDSGTNYLYKRIVSSITSTTANHLPIGKIDYASGSLQGASSGSIIIGNLKGALTSPDGWTPIALQVADREGINLGGVWQDSADITRIDLVEMGGRNMTGEVLLYFLRGAEQ